jgi:hypothetical protein
MIMSGVYGDGRREKAIIDLSRLQLRHLWDDSPKTDWTMV